MILKDVKLPIRYSEEMLRRAVIKAGFPKNETIRTVRILKRSIDARKKPDLCYVMTLAVNEKETVPGVVLPDSVPVPEHPVAVVGMGPAGLFAADILLKAGFPVLLLERGAAVEERARDVERFWETGVLDPGSNVQFGEGGAGMFSDGKLNTRTKDPDGYKEYVLHRFHALGAKEEVLYDTKAHIGTDALRKIVRAFRDSLLERGADIRFHACVTDLQVRGGRVAAVTVNGKESIPVSAVILAAGHSARDTYEMLLRHGVPMEKKAFAAGVRMEHSQELITLNQYGTLDYEELGAAPYAVTAKTRDGRGVFSFCMCPGGWVVNASSEPGGLCVNGMSYADRSSGNANAGIVVQVFPDDYDRLSGEPDSVLSGIAFQRMLERNAYRAGGGAVPVQTYKDFRDGNVPGTVPEVSEKLTPDIESPEASGMLSPKIKGAWTFADLNEALPAFMKDALKEAIPQFARSIPGFDADDALLSAVEARTSSPVRILRNEDGESALKGLYPCGEGAGYAGGIVSAAMDGIRTAVRLVRSRASEDGTA